MISGLDIALWDIKAQALGVPIYELLGGKVRENVPLYTHFEYKRTVEEMVESAVGEVGRGSTAIKTDPFSAAGGVPNGTYVECFHPDRDPLFWELIANRPPLRDGIYAIPDGPGWGLELDQQTIARYRLT